MQHFSKGGVLQFRDTQGFKMKEKKKGRGETKMERGDFICTFRKHNKIYTFFFYWSRRMLIFPRAEWAHLPTKLNNPPLPGYKKLCKLWNVMVVSWASSLWSTHSWPWFYISCWEYLHFWCRAESSVCLPALLVYFPLFVHYNLLKL